MPFLVDHKTKVIFSWCAKCGCSFIKNLYNFFLDKEVEKNKLHDPDSLHPLPKNHEDYKIILIIRNPYERLVSGFLDKYKSNGEFRRLWTDKEPLTFSNFVEALRKEGVGVQIEKGHFSSQFQEGWPSSIKFHRIYDITAIDYPYLEELFGKKIPKRILNFKKGHENKATEPVDFPVHNLTMDKYEGKRPRMDQFYTKQIAKKVEHIYKKDFEFFKLFKINYPSPAI